MGTIRGTVLKRVAAIMSGIVLVTGCGGGGSESAVATKDCEPTIYSGLKEEVISGGDGGAGGAGGGGAGAGASVGKLSNVEVSVEFADGRTLDPAPVGATDGMVTIAPCDYRGTAKIVFFGKDPAASYFDESMYGPVSFHNKSLEAVVDMGKVMATTTKMIGVSPLTKAAYEYTINLAQAEKAVVTAAPWHDAARVTAANARITEIINHQLPGMYRFDDITRMPVLVDENNFTRGSAALSDSNEGRYAAVLAGLVQATGAQLPADTSPALTLLDQLSADLADGDLDLVGGAGTPVAAPGTLAYAPETLPQLLGMKTGKVAALAGDAQLASKQATTVSFHARDPGEPDTGDPLYCTLRSNGVVSVGNTETSLPLPFAETADMKRNRRLVTFISEDRRQYSDLLTGSSYLEGSASITGPKDVRISDAGGPAVADFGMLEAYDQGYDLRWGAYTTSDSLVWLRLSSGAIAGFRRVHEFTWSEDEPRRVVSTKVSTVGAAGLAGDVGPVAIPNPADVRSFVTFFNESYMEDLLSGIFPPNCNAWPFREGEVSAFGNIAEIPALLYACLPLGRGGGDPEYRSVYARKAIGLTLDGRLRLYRFGTSGPGVLLPLPEMDPAPAVRLFKSAFDSAPGIDGYLGGQMALILDSEGRVYWLAFPQFTDADIGWPLERDLPVLKRVLLDAKLCELSGRWALSCDGDAYRIDPSPVAGVPGTNGDLPLPSEFLGVRVLEGSKFWRVQAQQEGEVTSGDADDVLLYSVDGQVFDGDGNVLPGIHGGTFVATEVVGADGSGAAAGGTL